MDARDYLLRIGADERLLRMDADETPPPSLGALAHLHERHLLTVPFENLDIHSGIPIILDERALVEKLVTNRRGGFCYELNGGFAWLLRQLGFDVALLSARVARPDGGWGIPFDHMLLRVDVARTSFIVDVGFGDGFVQPLELVAAAGDPARFHLVRDDDSWTLHDGEIPKYRFENVPRTLADFEPGCRYHQRDPSSVFTKKLITTRLLPDGGRVTLTADRLLLSSRTGEPSETAVESIDSWRSLLQEHFDIVPDRDPCTVFS